MKPKSTTPKKSAPSPVKNAVVATTSSHRKNARRFDTDPSDTTGTVLSTRVSKDMKQRALAAAGALGFSGHSDLMGYALCRVFSQIEQIVEAHKKTGVLPMSLVAMKAFRALGPAPEEIQYAVKWMPEKVEQLGVKRLQIENTLNELLARLEAVERLLKIKKLEPVKEDQTMRVEVDLI